MLSVYYFFTYGISQVLMLPVWWYTRGLNKLIQRLADWQIVEWRRLALWVWIKNLFTPMFHDYTIIGRGLSFVMRVIIITIRLVSLIAKFAFKVALLIMWILLPPITVIGLLASLFNLMLIS